MALKIEEFYLDVSHQKNLWNKVMVLQGISTKKVIAQETSDVQPLLSLLQIAQPKQIKFAKKHATQNTDLSKTTKIWDVNVPQHGLKLKMECLSLW